MSELQCIQVKVEFIYTAGKSQDGMRNTTERENSNLYTQNNIISSSGEILPK